MRQVPYAVIGAGRVARHFCHYLDLLNIPYRSWSRAHDAPQALLASLLPCERILLLISDGAIELFIREQLEVHPALKDKTRIHFSGALVTPQAFGAHPLMTFGQDVYSLAHYQKIPFVVEAGAPAFAELLPGLPNAHFTLPAEQKALYHSLCVLSGNFSCLLWQKLFTELEKSLNLPKEIAIPYLEQLTHNLQHRPEEALTGPLARGDQTTLDKNMAALEGDPFQKVYQAFVEAYREHS